MKIPARILRSHVMDIDRTLRELTQREEAREERILQDAQFLIARFGAAAITFTNLAIAIKVAPATMRRHFPDFDALLGEIMRRHLRAVAKAIAEIPPEAPDRRRQQRAAYLTATRNIGAPTEAHLILTTYRNTLPEDERTTVNDLRGQIGEMLSPGEAEATLHLLDCPHFDIAQIEAMLTAAQSPSPQPQPAAPPAAEPQPPPAFRLLADLSEISGVSMPGGKLMENIERAPFHAAIGRAPPGRTVHAA